MSNSPAWENSVMMRAARKLPTERAPIWLMRQAGRYMEEYRKVREKTTFLELCKNPALCAEVMLTAVDRIKVDAAIIFSDLLPILEPMGFQLEFALGEGPIIHNPLRESDDLKRIQELEDLSSLDFVFETVRMTREGLDESLPVIGFAGAPFTLAGYAIEGGGSRDFRIAKTFMYKQPSAWNDFLALLARSVARYLINQVKAGAQIVQVFDSWIGCLGCEDYAKYVLPHLAELVRLVKLECPQTPLIYFGTGNPALLPLMTQTHADVIGIDWRIEIDVAWEKVGPDFAIQGNLDPVVLLADQKTIDFQAKKILQKINRRPGFIFNLGHGVLPQTRPENVIHLVERVKEWGSHSQ